MDPSLNVEHTGQRRILVVGPSWVGDMVMAQSLFISLKQRLPDCHLDVLAPAWSLPLLERMPEVHEAIAMPVRHFQLAMIRRWRLGVTLRAKAYDTALVLPRSFKSSLVPFFARIPRRTGYKGEPRAGLVNDVRRLDKRVLRQTVQRFVALGHDAGAVQPPLVPEPRLRVDDANTNRLRDELGLEVTQKIVAMMPGTAFGPAKQWPAAYFATLARRLSGDGFEIWLLGSEQDAAVCEEIMHAVTGGVRNFCGRTRLVDSVDLIAQASVAVSNDSGLMHVAAAVGTPVIALFGSSTPAYTPPLSASAQAITLDLACSPCFKRRCPLKHTNCLRDIDPADVYTAVATKLEQPAGG